jgi:hypothetical protein
MSCKGIWLLFDLDGTITPSPHKAHGKYLPLNESVCNEPLREFMKQDGRLCVISTAGKRMWVQIYEPLRDILKEKYQQNVLSISGEGAEVEGKKKAAAEHEKGRFILSAFTGAGMYYNQGADAELQEDQVYRLQKKTTFLPEHVHDIFRLLREQIVFKIFETAAKDPSYVEILTKKYHSVFAHLLGVRERDGVEKFQETYLSLEKLTKHGEYLKETNDALLDVQYIPNVSDKIIAHINVLGVPMARYGDIFTQELRDTLISKYGVSAREQPNSVCVATTALDKTVPIEFILQEHKLCPYLHDFLAESAITCGDNIDSVDKPFTRFSEIACVSVGNKKLPEQVWNDLKKGCAKLVAIPGEEEGTAKLLQILLDESKKQEQDENSWEQRAKNIVAASLKKIEDDDKSHL